MLHTTSCPAILLQPQSLMTLSDSVPYAKLYSHYSCQPSCCLPIDVKELQKAMKNAQHSYKSWKQLQQQIRDAMRQELLEL